MPPWPSTPTMRYWPRSTGKSPAPGDQACVGRAVEGGSDMAVPRTPGAGPARVGREAGYESTRGILPPQQGPSRSDAGFPAPAGVGRTAFALSHRRLHRLEEVGDADAQAQGDAVERLDRRRVLAQL